MANDFTMINFLNFTVHLHNNRNNGVLAAFYGFLQVGSPIETHLQGSAFGFTL